MAVNTKKYIEEFLKIQSKNSKIIPLLLNKPQLKLYESLVKQYQEGKPQRCIILKARQMGFSTLTEAIIFKEAVTNHNVKCGIVTHEANATTNLFNMSKRYLDELPDELKPAVKASNAKELIFDNETSTGLKSSIKCMTAGNTSIGRSDTFQMLHISEFAYWDGDKEATLTGLLQAVPNHLDTTVIVESTANGYDQFKVMWDKAILGENDFVPIFCAWWEMEEYTMKGFDGVYTIEEKELIKLYGLTDGQLMWRRWCIKNNCAGNVDTFHQEYPSCPSEAFLSSGTCAFDSSQIESRLKRVKDPVLVGEFVYKYDGLTITDIKWQNKERGCIQIFKERTTDTPYVIGGDTAGEGSDSFTGHVLNNITGEQVAVLDNKFDEDIYARQMFCLGWYYNKALIGLETNFSTFPVKELQRLQYPNLYVRQTEDNYTHKPKSTYGFRTDMITRPIVIAGLATIIRDNVELVNHRKTLNECLTFARNEKGRPEAMKGAHDDHVMGLAIAYYIRPQQRTTGKEVKATSEFKWSDDLLEDYYNADEATKQLIINLYGEVEERNE